MTYADTQKLKNTNTRNRGIDNQVDNTDRKRNRQEACLTERERLRERDKGRTGIERHRLVDRRLEKLSQTIIFHTDIYLYLHDSPAVS